MTNKISNKHKKSQAELASQLDISINYISQLEKGRKQPSLKLLENISTIYGCSVASLVETDALKSELKQLVDKEGLESVLIALKDILNENK